MSEIFTHPLVPGLLVLVAVLFYFFQKPEFKNTSLHVLMKKVAIPTWMFKVLLIVGIPSWVAFVEAPSLAGETFSPLSFSFTVMPIVVIMSVFNEVLFRRDLVIKLSCSVLMVILVSWVTSMRVYSATISHFRTPSLGGEIITLIPFVVAPMLLTRVYYKNKPLFFICAITVVLILAYLMHSYFSGF